MRKTYSSALLERIAYFEHDGKADVYLRDNIEMRTTENEDGVAEVEYVADEVHIETNLPESEIEQNFDALWVKGETESKDLSDRVAELENLLDATIAVVLGEGRVA